MKAARSARQNGWENRQDGHSGAFKIKASVMLYYLLSSAWETFLPPPTTHVQVAAMKRFLQSLSRKTNIEADPLLYIIVAQYQRANFGVGSEHEFHWAIAVIESPQSTGKECPCYQAVNEIVPAPVPHVEWSLLIHPNAVLTKTNKYRGGVIVGRVRRSELGDLDNLLSNHLPVVAYDGWNCRNWVMEAIELMAAKGWIHAGITSQERLLPTLRVVHKATLAALNSNKPPVVYELDPSHNV